MSGRLKVKGMGRLSLKPDSIIIDLRIDTVDKDYGKAMKESSIKLESLYKQTEQVGLDKNSVKMNDFSVNSRYENKKDADGNYIKVFSGFCVTHQLKIEFANDMTVLNKLLYVLSQGKTECDLNISFTVKDKESPKSQLLKAAVKDAGDKANVIASAAGKTLKDIVSIDYGAEGINLISPTRFNVREAMVRGAYADNGCADINPDDIVLSDTVTIEWEIE